MVRELAAPFSFFFFFRLINHIEPISHAMFLRIEPAKSLYLYVYCIYVYIRKYEMMNSWLIPLARVNQILAAMSEQVFFTGDVMRHVCRIGRFPCINIKPVLALLWKADRECHHVVVGD